MITEQRKEELKKIADNLIPIEKLFFKDGKGWALDRLQKLTKEEYDYLEELVDD